MSKKNERKWKRSGTECCEVCEEKAPLVGHHIHGREIRRAEESWNKAWICPTCHDKIHLGHIIIEGWFNSTNGLELFHRTADEEMKVSEGAIPPSY